MEKSNIGVHLSHCCKLHGCKYGEKDCPVVMGEGIQKYPCEDCDDDDMDMDMIQEVVKLENMDLNNENNKVLVSKKLLKTLLKNY